MSWANCQLEEEILWQKSWRSRRTLCPSRVSCCWSFWLWSQFSFSFGGCVISEAARRHKRSQLYFHCSPGHHPRSCIWEKIAGTSHEPRRCRNGRCAKHVQRLGYTRRLTSQSQTKGLEPSGQIQADVEYDEYDSSCGGVLGFDVT